MTSTSEADADRRDTDDGPLDGITVVEDAPARSLDRSDLAILLLGLAAAALVLVLVAL